MLLLPSVLLTAYANGEISCYDEAVQGCRGAIGRDMLENCNAEIESFTRYNQTLQAYANEQISRSFQYLLLSANFGSFVKNRPGFKKQFTALSDKAWNNGINIIKHITKRGSEHNFGAVSAMPKNAPTSLDLNEIQALTLSLVYEKAFLVEAHHIHRSYSHAYHQHHYDPEIAHFMEEKFFGQQTDTIRKLSGYINDLQKMSRNAEDISLPLYMFDEYLEKQ